MIFLIGVAAELADLPAVDGARLGRASCAGLDLVFSKDEPPVLTHARIVAAVAERSAAVLPARFGHAFPDLEALERSAAGSADALRAGLERVRGCVELGLQVVDRQGAPEPRSGRDYMERRLERERVVRELASLARESRRMAFLVEPARLPAFRRRAALLEEAHPTLSLTVMGPWPPYSFAEVE